jgi:hypothetical protein
MPALASPPAWKPTGWKRARSLRLGECDGRYQGDQPSAIKKLNRGYNFLKSGLGQGFPVKSNKISNNYN